MKIALRGGQKCADCVLVVWSIWMRRLSTKEVDRGRAVYQELYARRYEQLEEMKERAGLGWVGLALYFYLENLLRHVPGSVYSSSLSHL